MDRDELLASAWEDGEFDAMYYAGFVVRDVPKRFADDAELAHVWLTARKETWERNYAHKTGLRDRALAKARDALASLHSAA